MPINATLINLYHVCHRELWLHFHGIRMEHTSEMVYEGKLIGESTYDSRATKNRQIVIEGVKIDFYDPQTQTVYETKRSDKMEEAHIAQVKYYLYILFKNGVGGAKGIIEYPTLRKRTLVAFDSVVDIPMVEMWVRDIDQITCQERIPGVLHKAVCRSCSYFDYCYVEESK